MHYAVLAASSPAIKVLLLYNVDINLSDDVCWQVLCTSSFFSPPLFLNISYGSALVWFSTGWMDTVTSCRPNSKN